MVTDHPLVDSHNSAAGIEECVEEEWEGGLYPPRDEALPLVAGKQDVWACVLRFLGLSCGIFECV